MTHKRHVQGYMEFEKAVRFSFLTKRWFPGTHVEKRMGTAQQAKAYCTKDESRAPAGETGEYGNISTVSKGARTDLTAATDSILQGKRMRDVALENPATFVKYSRGLSEFAKFAAPPMVEIPKTCYIFWGEPGSGKSTRAFELADKDFYVPEVNNAGKYSFENYDGQAWLLLEEFDGSQLPSGELKKIMDKWPCTLPGRGYSKQGRHSGVILTSNVNPASWYKGEHDWPAIRRRCAEVWEYTRNWCSIYKAPIEAHTNPEQIENPYRPAAAAAAPNFIPPNINNIPVIDLSQDDE